MATFSTLSGLKTEITNQIIDNNSQLITPRRARETMLSMADSLNHLAGGASPSQNVLSGELLPRRLQSMGVSTINSNETANWVIVKIPYVYQDRGMNDGVLTMEAYFSAEDRIANRLWMSMSRINNGLAGRVIYLDARHASIANSGSYDDVFYIKHRGRYQAGSGGAGNIIHGAIYLIYQAGHDSFLPGARVVYGVAIHPASTLLVPPNLSAYSSVVSNEVTIESRIGGHRFPFHSSSFLHRCSGFYESGAYRPTQTSYSPPYQGTTPANRVGLPHYANVELERLTDATANADGSLYPWGLWQEAHTDGAIEVEATRIDTRGMDSNPINFYWGGESTNYDHGR